MLVALPDPEDDARRRSAAAWRGTYLRAGPLCEGARDLLAGGLERLVELGWVAPAGLGHGVAAPAAPADHRGCRLDDLPRPDAAVHRARSGGHQQAHAALAGR